MPGPYSRKCIQFGRKAVRQFSYLYEEEGRLDEAMECLEEHLKDRRYLHREHVLLALRKKYPELDL